jgi:hypothetical protein
MDLALKHKFLLLCVQHRTGHVRPYDSPSARFKLRTVCKYFNEIWHLRYDDGSKSTFAVSIYSFSWIFNDAVAIETT